MKQGLYIGLLVLSVLIVQYGECKFNMTEYYQMPPLYKFDNYEKCLHEYSPEMRATYCVVRTEIKPDAKSKSWEIIEKISADRKMTYHHEIIERGVCVHACENAISALTEEQADMLYQEIFNDINKMSFRPPDYFPTSLEDRKQFERIINQCINLELRTFNLSGYSDIVFCHSSDDNNESDNTVIAFFIILGIIVGLNIFSTIYDVSQKDGNTKDHFKTPLKDKSKMWLVIFSIPRNFLKLVSTTESEDELVNDFKFINAIRFCGMISMVYGHIVLSINYYPSANPHAIEEHLQETSATQYEGVQVFFTISAFLVTVFYVHYMRTTKTKPSSNLIWMAIIDRFIRFTPVYAFMMFIHATMLGYLFSGPMMKQMYSEQYNCRHYWWTNLLYINNYVKVDYPCVQQTWYLGADFQLYILVMTILYFICKYPGSTKKILGTLLALSYAVIAVITYYMKFDGTVIVTLDSQRQVLWFEDNYVYNYLPAHVNFGSSIIGIIGGLIFHDLRERKVDIMKYMTFRIIWYIYFPIGVLTVYIAKLFYINEFEKPSLWISLYAAFARHIYGWVMCIMLIGFGLDKKSFIRKIFSHSIFKPLAKISYCIFICHMFVINLVNVNQNTEMVYGMRFLYSFLFTTICTSMVMAPTLCICIEIPTATIYKNLQMKLKAGASRTSQTKKKAENKTN